MKPASINQHNLLINSIENLSSGALNPATSDPQLVYASQLLSELNSTAKKLVTVIVLSVSILCMALAWVKVSPKLKARQMVEKIFKRTLLAAACLAIFATLGIILSVLFEAIRFFQLVPATDFLLGTEWSPQMAIRTDQVGSSGSFGAIPLFLSLIHI